MRHSWLFGIAMMMAIPLRTYLSACCISSVPEIELGCRYGFTPSRLSEFATDAEIALIKDVPIEAELLGTRAVKARIAA
jgi:hypothetical protein